MTEVCVQEVLMSEEKQSEQPGGQPAEPKERPARASTLLHATLEYLGGEVPTTHRVRDLSAGGVRIDRAEGLSQGSPVLVSIGAIKAIAATVMWVKDGFAGLGFEESIDPANARAKAFLPAVDAASLAKAPVAAKPAPSAGWIGDLRSPYRK